MIINDKLGEICWAGAKIALACNKNLMFLFKLLGSTYYIFHHQIYNKTARLLESPIARWVDGRNS